MTIKHTTSQRKTMGLGIALFALFLILVLTLAPVPTDTQTITNVQPELLMLVDEQPDARVDVIVQKTVADDSAAALVTELGGEIAQELNLINGFVAEMRAKDVAVLAADASVNWISLDAPVVEVSQISSSFVRDEFNVRKYFNNDGTVNWGTDWQEINDDDHPTMGGVRAWRDQTLRLMSSNKGIQRAVDLSSADTAIISLDYRRKQLERTTKFVTLEVSSDGGATWTEIGIFAGPADETEFLSFSYDISDFATANTIIRLMTSENMGTQDWIYFDNVQIDINSGPINVSPRAIGANDLWHEGYRGNGVTVAVVDSGIANHDDLQEDENTTFRIVAEVNFLNNSSTADDLYGHGTHVAGIIGGNGKAHNLRYYGVAPRANLIDVKVIDATGVGTISDVVAGLEWIYENKDLYNIQVVNLSLNSTVAESYHNSPLNAALEILWFNGVVVVVSAGNNGSMTPGVLYPPANDPFVIVVGATNDQGTKVIVDDEVMTYSAYGVTVDGFAKPDLVAHGHNIISLLSSNTSTLAQDHPEKMVISGGTDGYMTMSGTSMASAVVSGAVAQLLQAEPGLTPDQVKYRLMHTARDGWSGYDPQKAGAGSLNIYAAVHTSTSESANQDTMPHMLLAKMALIAYWASNNGGETIDWAAVDWETVNWDTVDWNSVNWGSVNWGSVNWGSVNWGSVNWGSVNWGSVNWGSVNWGSVNWGSVNWGSVNWGSTNAPSVDFSE